MAIVVGRAIIPPHRPTLPERRLGVVHRRPRLGQIATTSFGILDRPPRVHELSDKLITPSFGQCWVGCAP